MADKIILKFKTKNILNFYEIEPRSYFTFSHICDVASAKE